MKLAGLLLGLIGVLLVIMGGAQAATNTTDWQSIDELNQWWAEHKGEVVVEAQAGVDGVVQFNNQCYGLALGYHNLAAQYGKNLYPQMVTPLQYNEVFGTGIGNNHVIIMAVVGQAYFYWIDPSIGIPKKAGYIP